MLLRIEIIGSLENKSTGPSSIPLKLSSLIPDLIIVPLASIINMSLQSGVYPDLLKLVKVIPIHKGGSAEDVDNYRRISLLSLIKLLKNECIKVFTYFLKPIIFYLLTNFDFFLGGGGEYFLFFHLFDLKYWNFVQKTPKNGAPPPTITGRRVVGIG